MNITSHILSKTNLIETESEITPTEDVWQMFNSGGVEVEIGEFLYGLMRSMKPDYVMETGTHLGISGAYIGMALKHNDKGHMDTCEVIPSLRQQAIELWKELELSGFVTSHLVASLKFPKYKEIDFLFLDSEPQFRFNEFHYFWPMVKQGGFIAIHDLHPTLGHSGQTHDNMYDWPYGYWKSETNGLSKYIDSNEIQIIHLPSPRGFTLFQKLDPTWEVTKHLNSKE